MGLANVEFHQKGFLTYQHAAEPVRFVSILAGFSRKTMHAYLHRIAVKREFAGRGVSSARSLTVYLTPGENNPRPFFQVIYR